MRKRSLNNPLLQCFQQQRGAAKHRSIPWKLPYWEWLQIWQESGHLEERGCYKGEWVMARNGDKGAYEAGNVKIVRCETNNREARAGKPRARPLCSPPSHPQPKITRVDPLSVAIRAPLISYKPIRGGSHLGIAYRAARC